MAISILVYIFGIVFLLNLIPILGPPTWAVLSFISFTYPIPSLPWFVLVALCAATLGRLILTLFAKRIIRNHLLSDKHRKNMNYLKRHLEKRRHFVFLFFFLEAFTPLPSDQFFIAYGLTDMKLRYAFVPFVTARIFTYSFWIYFANDASKGNWANSLANLSFLSWPFVLGEAALLILVYFFVQVDWEHLILNGKFRMLK